MLENQSSARVQRERDFYNQGIVRTQQHKALLELMDHSPSYERYRNCIRELLTTTKGQKGLEIGSCSWTSWIDFNDYAPRRLNCINISDSELAKGMTTCKTKNLEGIVKFELMDAHCLSFEDSTFNFVFGNAILHHLDIKKAIPEIHRVLKPGGQIIFSEPLIYNPMGRVLRFLTPRARTVDERPISIGDIELIKQYFDTNCSFFQLFDIPINILFSLLKKPNNMITTAVEKFDFSLSKVPYLQFLYRIVIIHGIKN